jgi:putative addiction module component (TIGR02574 family)
LRVVKRTGYLALRRLLEFGPESDVTAKNILDNIRESETEDGAEEAWCKEIERRAQGIESGAVQAISWETARARLMRKSATPT